MAFALTATTRTRVGKQTRVLRAAGQIPAVLYGHGITNQNLVLDLPAFERVYAKAKESSLVDLTIDGGSPTKVIIHDAQPHPLTGKWLHVDFHQVSMKEKLETEIDLLFTGESMAVKELGGILVKSIDKVKVTCLPGDLVQSLMVDLSLLKSFEDALRISDIQVPAGITIMADSTDVLATVTPPRTEAEIASLEDKVEADASTVEVVGKVKTDEEAEATDDEAAASGAKNEKNDKKEKKEDK